VEIVPTEQPTDEDVGSGKVGLRHVDAGDRRAASSSSEGDDNNQQKSQPKEQNNQPHLTTETARPFGLQRCSASF